LQRRICAGQTLRLLNDKHPLRASASKPRLLFKSRKNRRVSKPETLRYARETREEEENDMRTAIAIVTKLSAAMVAALLLTTLLAGVPPQQPGITTPGSPDPTVRQGYRITDLGTLGGGTSVGFDVNDRGQVSGYSNPTPDSCLHAFLWERGFMKDLGTLGGDCSLWPRLNLLGEVVGVADTDEGTSHAFLWKKGAMTDLGTLGGPNSGANGISLLSDVVGNSETNSIDPDTGQPAYHAFLWRRGVMLDLGTRGGVYSSAFAVDARGRVAGWGEVADKDPVLGYRPYRATLWVGNGKMLDLGTLGGKNSEAFKMNELGQITGDADLVGDNETHAFLWDKGIMKDLGVPSGYLDSMGWGINAQAQVCGWAFDADWNVTGFIWRDGVMADLNELIPPDAGWWIVEARGINDWGQIAATGVRTDTGDYHALLLSPTGRYIEKQSQASLGARRALISSEAHEELRELFSVERTPGMRGHRQVLGRR